MLRCETSLVVCPFCGELVGSEAVQFGVERLHPECYYQLIEELWDVGSELTQAG